MFNNSGGSFNLFKKGKLNDFRVWKSKRNAGNENIMYHIGRNVDRIKKGASILNGEDKDQLLIQKQQKKKVYHISYNRLNLGAQAQLRIFILFQVTQRRFSLKQIRK